MPIGRSLLVLAILASVGLRAETVRTLDGKEIVGDVVSITDKEIVVRSEGKEVTVPVLQVLLIDIGAAGKLPTKYIDVELTDATLLHCSQVSLRGKDAILTLTSGQEVKIPQTIIASYIGDAQDEKLQKQWKEIASRKRSGDFLVVKTANDELTTLNGTFGDSDAEGKEIQFDHKNTGTYKPIELAKIQGIAFYRPLDPDLPSTACFVHDSSLNAIAAASVTVTPNGFTVTTPAKAKIEYTKKLLARIDYNTGKLRYLSDMKPTKSLVSSTQGDPEAPRSDKNLDGGPLRLGKLSYPKGLSIHAYTQLEYQLDGEYREFKCVLGVDATVGGSQGPTLVKIEADNKELFSGPVTPKDDPKELRFNIKDVQKLKITVSSGELLDLGKHVNLADAKISK
jgi:hypothetical protein